jgi:hypothetical protein
MKDKKQTHGGKRAGSGRPKMDVERVNVTITKEHLAWLKANGGVSETIRALVDQAMKEKIIDRKDEA